MLDTMSREDGEHGSHSLCPWWAYYLQAYPQNKQLPATSLLSYSRLLSAQVSHLSATAVEGYFLDFTVTTSQGYFRAPPDSPVSPTWS